MVSADGASPATERVSKRRRERSPTSVLPREAGSSFLVRVELPGRASLPSGRFMACSPCPEGCHIYFDLRRGAAEVRSAGSGSILSDGAGLSWPMRRRGRRGTRWRASRARRWSTCAPPRSGTMSACPTSPRSARRCYRVEWQSFPSGARQSGVRRDADGGVEDGGRRRATRRSTSSAAPARAAPRRRRR